MKDGFAMRHWPKISWFFCKLMGHEYYVEEVFSRYVRKLGCYCCSSKFGMHDQVEALVPWDNELERVCAVLK